MKVIKKKIMKVGNSLSVNLPHEFVKNNGLIKGDEIHAEYDENEIVFKGSQDNKKKEITVDISEFNYYDLIRYLTILYIDNYDRITLKYDKSTFEKIQHDINIFRNKTFNHPKELLHTELTLTYIIHQRLIGAELISNKDNVAVIEIFAKHDTQVVDEIERRIFLLFKNFAQDLKKALSNNYNNFFDNISDWHDLCTRLVTYYRRIIQKSAMHPLEKQHTDIFLQFIDSWIDRMMQITIQIKKHGITEKVQKTLSNIFQFFLNEYSRATLLKLSEETLNKKFSLLQTIENTSFSNNELKIILEATPLLSSVTQFSNLTPNKKVQKPIVSITSLSS